MLERSSALAGKPFPFGNLFGTSRVTLNETTNQIDITDSLLCSTDDVTHVILNLLWHDLDFTFCYKEWVSRWE
jgi:hypothetical protein